MEKALRNQLLCAAILLPFTGPFVTVWALGLAFSLAKRPDPIRIPEWFLIAVIASVSYALAYGIVLIGQRGARRRPRRPIVVRWDGVRVACLLAASSAVSLAAGWAFPGVPLAMVAAVFLLANVAPSS